MIPKQILENPQIYGQILIDLVQKLGLTAAIAIILIIFLCGLVIYLMRHVTKGYKASINVLNEQNKRYQDYFLESRRSSGKKFLDEKPD
jgi:hypothetical protein